MNTCFPDFTGSCSWIPGSRAVPAPRKDAVFELPDSLESGVRALRGFGGCPRPALCTAAAYDAGAADAMANMLAFVKDTAAARC